MSNWATDDLKSMADRYNGFLRFATTPVAVKFFENIKEAEAITDTKGRPIRKATQPMALCQFLAQSRYMSRVQMATPETVGECKPGALSIGFDPLPEDYPQGYVGLYFNSFEKSKNMFDNMPTLPLGKYKAILSAPLDKMPIDPDLVIFFGNAAQIYKMVMAWGWDSGERLTFTASGEAWCADAIAPPMLNGTPHLAFCCNGGRILSWPSDDEVSIGLPASELEHILSGLEFQHKGGIRYPITWFHITWPIGPPVSKLMQPRKK
jgi:uncharacterized protein (DUF169 family)